VTSDAAHDEVCSSLRTSRRGAALLGLVAGREAVG
jgi:hypothetical protein